MLRTVLFTDYSKQGSMVTTAQKEASDNRKQAQETLCVFVNVIQTEI